MTCEYAIPCPELHGKVLSGRTWEIWNGTAEGMTESECEEFRRFWRGDIATQSAIGPKRDNCVHLGPPTGETRQCPSCQGTVMVKLFACELHKRCTLAKPIYDVACCAGCGDYSPKESV